MTLANPISYADYRKQALSGDILLCRASSIEGHLIADITRAKYSHASMAGWINVHRRDEENASALMIAESVQHHGKRIIPLSGEIRQYSGIYDVYRPRYYHRYDGEAAFAYMCRAANSRYGWLNIWRVLCRRHLPWPFTLFPAVPNSDDPQAKRDCSAEVHSAVRLYGDMLIKRFDSDCEPGDISDPGFTGYKWTLYFGDEAARNAMSFVASEPQCDDDEWTEEWD